MNKEKACTICEIVTNIALLVTLFFLPPYLVYVTI